MGYSHNFWLEGPIDLRPTRLNCILQDPSETPHLSIFCAPAPAPKMHIKPYLSISISDLHYPIVLYPSLFLNYYNILANTFNPAKNWNLGLSFSCFPFWHWKGAGVSDILAFRCITFFSDFQNYQTSSTQIPSNPKRPWKKIPQRVRGFHQTRPRETQSCREVILFQPTCSGTCSTGQSRILRRISENKQNHSSIES